MYVALAPILNDAKAALCLIRHRHTFGWLEYSFVIHDGTAARGYAEPTTVLERKERGAYMERFK